jgi:hypothetical protein
VTDFANLQKAVDDLKAEAARSRDLLQRLVTAIGSNDQATVDAITAQVVAETAAEKTADDAADAALNPAPAAPATPAA